MRFLVPALLALPAVGCVHVRHVSGGTETLVALDEKGVSLPEAWAVSWSRNRTCPLGLWYPFGTYLTWPDLRSISDVRLQRLTRGDNRAERPPQYTAYVLWGLLLFPPGSYCESWHTRHIFAAGCPWGFGEFRSHDGRLLSRARGAPPAGREPFGADHVRAEWIAEALDRLHDDPAVPRQDLRDFAAMLLKNFERLGVREEAWPDVVRRVNEMTASER